MKLDKPPLGPPPSHTTILSMSIPEIALACCSTRAGICSAISSRTAFWGTVPRCSDEVADTLGALRQDRVLAVGFGFQELLITLSLTSIEDADAGSLGFGDDASPLPFHFGGHDDVRLLLGPVADGASFLGLRLGGECLCFRRSRCHTLGGDGSPVRFRCALAACTLRVGDDHSRLVLAFSGSRFFFSDPHASLAVRFGGANRSRHVPALRLGSSPR